MKATKVRFVSMHPRGYRLLNETNKKVIIRRDVTFNETKFGDLEEPAAVKDSAVLEAVSSEPVTPSEVGVRSRPER